MNPTYFNKVGTRISDDVNNRVDRVIAIQNRDTGMAEEALQTFGQGAGAAANAIESVAFELPIVKQTVEGFGAGIQWLASTEPMKAIGNVIGENRLLQEIVQLYDNDPNFKDNIDAIANTVRLGVDVNAVSQATRGVSNAVKEAQRKIHDSTFRLRLDTDPTLRAKLERTGIDTTRLAQARTFNEVVDSSFGRGGRIENVLKFERGLYKNKYYLDPVKKTLNPSVAQNVVNEAGHDLSVLFNNEVASKFPKMFGDFKSVTAEDIFRNARLVVEQQQVAGNVALSAVVSSQAPETKPVVVRQQLISALSIMRNVDLLVKLSERFSKRKNNE